MTDQIQAAFNAIQGTLSNDVNETRCVKDYESHLKGNAIGDLLCNLMLFCQEYNIDFEDQLQYAKNHYFFEKNDYN